MKFVAQLSLLAVFPESGGVIPGAGTSCGRTELSHSPHSSSAEADL